MDWETAKRQITSYLEEYLFKIEWYYGEGRAPFCYPPVLEVEKEGNKLYYTCTLHLDYSDTDEKLIIRAREPFELQDRVKETVNRQFTNFE